MYALPPSLTPSFSLSCVPQSRYIGEIADGLMATLTTMQKVPLIQCASGGPAEMVAQKLDEMVRFNLASDDSLFDADGLGGFGTDRPVLLIVDRNLDLSAALRHTSTCVAS